MERDTIVQRMTMGKERKFNENKRVSGRISYGYKKVDDDIVKDMKNKNII